MTSQPKAPALSLSDTSAKLMAVLRDAATEAVNATAASNSPMPAPGVRRYEIEAHAELTLAINAVESALAAHDSKTSPPAVGNEDVVVPSDDATMLISPRKLAHYLCDAVNANDGEPFDGDEIFALAIEACADQVNMLPATLPIATEARPDILPLLQLIEYCDESDSHQYGTLSVTMVRELVTQSLDAKYTGNAK